MSIAGPPGEGGALVVRGEIPVAGYRLLGRSTSWSCFAGCLERTWHFVGIDEYCIRSVSRRGRNCGCFYTALLEIGGLEGFTY